MRKWALGEQVMPIKGPFSGHTGEIIYVDPFINSGKYRVRFHHPVGKLATIEFLFFGEMLATPAEGELILATQGLKRER